MTSPSPTSPSSVRSEKRSTICVELTFDYPSRSHPLYIEAQECLEYSGVLTKEEELEYVRAMTEHLMDRVAELFGIQVLSLLDEEGVFYGGEPGTRIEWHHGDTTRSRTYTE